MRASQPLRIGDNRLILGFFVAYIMIGVAACATVVPPAASSATTTSPPKAAPVSVKPICSQVKDYEQKDPKTGKTQAQELAEATLELDANSIIIVALADYAKMRAEARACQAKG